MWSPALALALTLAVAAAASPTGPIENIVAVGDSYTDNARGAYIATQGHNPPPNMTFPPDNGTTYTGGKNWVQFLRLMNNNANLANYAVAGAVCNSSIVTHYLNGAVWPNGDNYQVPTFQQEANNANIFPNRTADNTVYAIWFGTNDLGILGFLGGLENLGKIITDLINCFFAIIDAYYALGGRRFVIIGQAAQDRIPYLAYPGIYGLTNQKFFSNPATYNTSDYLDRMRQYITDTDTMVQYAISHFLCRTSRWANSTMSYIAVRSLMLDMAANPGAYFDAPGNTDTPYRNCLVPGCLNATGSPNGYMW